MYNGAAMKRVYTVRHPKNAFLEGFLSVFGFYPQANTRLRHVVTKRIRARTERQVGYWQSVGGYLRSAMDQLNSEVKPDGQEKPKQEKPEPELTR